MKWANVGRANMANYTLTGTLGSGKSLISISKIKEYLQAGRPVASNIDVYLDKLLPPMSRQTYTRLMDFPRAEDFWNLGKASDSKHEDTFGGVFLDELAVFLNSRDWQGKARDETIKFLRHIRKQHWHTFFLTQDIESIDKQARLALIEHKVECKRTDRLSIPVIGGIMRLFGFAGKFMQVHIGVVRYGKEQHAPVVEWWKVVGHGLRQAYNTDQIFTDNPYYDFECPKYWLHKRPFNTPVLIHKETVTETAYQEGTYTVLSPWHTKGRYMSLFDQKRYLLKPFIYLLTALFVFLYIDKYGEGIQQATKLIKEQPKIEYIKAFNYIKEPHQVTFTTKEGDVLTSNDFFYTPTTVRMKVGNKWFESSQ